VGGGEPARKALLEADRRAPDPNQLSAYQLDEGRRLERLEGRRSGTLEKAVRDLASVKPLDDERAAELIARGRGERQEAIRFATQMAQRPPVATYALMAACIGMFGLSLLWARGAGEEFLLRMGGNSGQYVREGQVWRMVSAMFLHSLANQAHIVVNMLSLWGFGTFIERVLGWRRYVLVYGAAGLGGFAASAFISNVQLSIGASGAIWGLMLAGFALTRGNQNIFPARIARQLRGRLLPILVLNVALSFLPRIDKFAHFAGGLIGFALIASGVLAPRPADAPGDDSPYLRLLAWAVVIAMAGSVVIALLSGQPWQPGPSQMI
jgi:membrane associated rhomboid family serine protease